MTELRHETRTAIAAVQEALVLAKLGAGDVHAKIGRECRDRHGRDHRRSPPPVVDQSPRVAGHRRRARRTGSPEHSLLARRPDLRHSELRLGHSALRINAATVEDGRVAVSVVGDGSTGDVLVAEVGRGAWRVREGGSTLLSKSAASLIVDFEAWPKAGPKRDRSARHRRCGSAGSLGRSVLFDDALSSARCHRSGRRLCPVCRSGPGPRRGRLTARRRGWRTRHGCSWRAVDTGREIASVQREPAFPRGGPRPRPLTDP